MAFRRPQLINRLLRVPHSRCHVAAAPATRDLAVPPLLERLRAIGGERLRLDAVVAPRMMTVEEARKVLRVSEMERVRERLRATPGSSIGYDRLVEICGGGEGGKGIARALDQSGAVLVLGDVVFHRPDQETDPS